MAFGLTDGTIIFVKSKNLYQNDTSTTVMNADTKAIKCVYFSKIDNSLNLFYTTDEVVYSYLDMSKRKKLH
jgi:hypothetical protein